MACTQPDVSACCLHRWYGSVVTLPSGRIYVAGGTEDYKKATGVVCVHVKWTDACKRGTCPLPDRPHVSFFASVSSCCCSARPGSMARFGAHSAWQQASLEQVQPSLGAHPQLLWQPASGPRMAHLHSWPQGLRYGTLLCGSSSIATASMAPMLAPTPSMTTCSVPVTAGTSHVSGLDGEGAAAIAHLLSCWPTTCLHYGTVLLCEAMHHRNHLPG
jgi:hypothetical protein